jgi:hypothetical protein
MLTGKARPPISPSQVTIYWDPPPQYQEIASLDATRRSVFDSGGEKATLKVIERLRTEAARLGANGVIVGEMSDEETGSIGSGVGTESYSRRSAVSINLSGAFGIYEKTGRGTAIYVSPSP